MVVTGMFHIKLCHIIDTAWFIASTLVSHLVCHIASISIQSGTLEASS